MDGKFVLLKCIKTGSAMEDMTVGHIYAGYLPVSGELDCDNIPVGFDDEVWIYKDDVGDEVVTRLSYGLEIVAQ